MAYVSKEKKLKIKAALDLVVPRNWEWSLTTHSFASVLFTVFSAPIPIETFQEPCRKCGHHEKNFYVSPHQLERFFRGDWLNTMRKILAALNIENYDHSDGGNWPDDVGHYVFIAFGTPQRPYRFHATGEEEIPF